MALRFDRADRAPLALVALLPLVLALPQVLGWVGTDPLVHTAQTAADHGQRLLPGVPAIDPNSGFTTQALGRRAALEWLEGKVPWWNPYSGVGLPLAAEYQPAALSPLTFLLLLPHGMAWHQAALQALAGIGAFGLLRQLQLGRLAAAAGGLLFAFNGALAWFTHAPATAIAWVPWMAWGVERAFVHARDASPGGWRLFAVALAMSLLAGFPESAYAGGLLALVWALVRGATLPRARMLAMAARVIPAGLIGLALTAPQTFAFFHFLGHADIGQHADYSRSGYPWFGLMPSLFAPYFFGPIFAFHGEWEPLVNLWGGLGGYVSAALVVAAVHGLFAAPTAINRMLAVWILLALGKSYLVQPALFLWNLVPGVTFAAFARYVQPTWELGFIVLAASGIDRLAKSADGASRAPLIAGLALASVAAIMGWMTWTLWPAFPQHGSLRSWSLGSVAAALAAAALVAGLLAMRRRSLAVPMLAAVLVGEACALYHLPSLSGSRGAEPGTAAIAFLREHLGLQRFFTLGPVQPNYGAYFGIASINHNYLPVARRWVDFVRARLDSAADAVVFNGSFGRAPGAPSQAAELRRNLAAYEWVGVKYVIAYTTHEPPFPPGEDTPRRAYSDAWMTIYELRSPKPYFEVVRGDCQVRPLDRTLVDVDCAAGATLVRRELHFPGWTGRVNGVETHIAEHGGLFQEIALPPGRSEVRFAYAPPYIGWAWFLAAIGSIALVAGPRLALRLRSGAVERVRAPAPRP